MDRIVQNGNTVKIHYIAKFESGEVFESSLGKKPLIIRIGHGEIIPIIEQTLVGMKEGEIKTILIPPEKAYGPKKSELIMEMPHKALGNIAPKKGLKIKLPSQTGKEIIAEIIDIKPESVTIDANHLLAGKTLVYDLKVVEIV